MGFLGGSFGGDGSLFGNFMTPVRSPDMQGGFNPADQKMGDAAKAGGKPGGFDVASALAALGGMGGQQQLPPPPPIMQLGPMPGPQFSGSLQGAPRIQQQMMPTPQYMAPYMWGSR